ncbi:MAG: T9SS type A sorting domain-containing protein [Chitinophagales bacterium]|nr:T9SS type A sorting domain-containing protein [Chitinophagales bacterium]
MKNIIILIFLIFCFNILLGQGTIDIKFNEANPIWVHTMVDSSFVPIPNQPNYTKYSSLDPQLIHRINDHIYLMASSIAPDGILDQGFILDKLSLNNGQKHWSHTNTPYVGGDNNFYRTLCATSDTSIALFGLEVKGAEGTFTSYKIINDQNGSLITHHVSSEPNPTKLPHSYYHGIYYESDSTYLNYYNIMMSNNPPYDTSFTYYNVFEAYDSNLDLIKVSNIDFDFEITDYRSVAQPSLIHQLNNTTIVGLVYKNKYMPNQKQEVYMMWSDISNPRGVKKVRQREYSDIIPFSAQTFLLHSFNAINNTIFLSHAYKNDNNQYLTFALWLDSIGDVKTYIPILQSNNHQYYFADIFYANDEYAYLLCYPSSTGNEGYDIIKIEKDNPEAIFVSSITTVNKDESYSATFHAFFEDGYLIFGGYVKKAGQANKTSTKYFCFKASDLGIITKTVATDDLQPPVDIEYSIFPNPATNNIHVECAASLQNSNLILYDLYGKTIIKADISHTNPIVDISNLPNGVYIVKVLNNDGNLIGSPKKIIKIE